MGISYELSETTKKTNEAREKEIEQTKPHAPVSEILAVIDVVCFFGQPEAHVIHSSSRHDGQQD